MEKSKYAEFQKNWSKVIAKAWSDEKFCARLKKDPVTVCKEYGITFPQGVKVNVHQESKGEVHLVIPPLPSSDLFETEIKAISGGSCACACTTVCACQESNQP